MLIKIKKYYIHFVEKEEKNIFEFLFYGFLYLLSLLYGGFIYCKNFLFNQKILSPKSIDKKIISVGNISWGGSGKTSFVIKLHKKLSQKLKVASITKGYAQDEFLLLKQELIDVFDARDRITLVGKISSDFELLILDDGFQYRKLARDIDIVIMGANEFKKNHRLIPAYIFREPLSSLKRANIVILNHFRSIKNIEQVEQGILNLNPDIKIYRAEYKYKAFLDKNKNFKDITYFDSRKCAVLTAIGYPQAFIDAVKKIDINLCDSVIYPDHYQFDFSEIEKIEDKLQDKGIKDLIITYKDFYHLDLSRAKLNYFIFDVDLYIENEDKLFSDIKALLRG